MTIQANRAPGNGAESVLTLRHPGRPSSCEYIGLLNKYGHTAETAPPGARLMQLRMFYIPDEAAEPEEIGH